MPVQMNAFLKTGVYLSSCLLCGWPGIDWCFVRKDFDISFLFLIHKHVDINKFVCALNQNDKDIRVFGRKY